MSPSHLHLQHQTRRQFLRAAGQSNAYESLKEQTRGRTLTAADYKAWVESVEVSEKVRAQLAALSPHSYIGLAIKLVDSVIAGK